MSEDEARSYFLKAFEGAAIAHTMGLSLEYNDDGEAIIRMRHNPGFHHGMKDTHGGVFATMLDSAGWFTAAARCRKIVVTSDLHVRMLEGARHRDLVATARLIRAGSRTAVAEMWLHAGDGDLVAVGTASFTAVADIPG